MNGILETKQLTKKFPVKAGIFGGGTESFVHAVEDVSLSIKEGETFGIVGESGCGKTTVAKLLLRVLLPSSGNVLFRDMDIYNPEFSVKEFRKKVQFIFQDPYSSLNPRMTVYDIIGEAFDIHKLAQGKEKTQKILDLMKTVGLADFHLYRYPHEFSGGQRQRVAIARALAVEPEVLVMDEPVSALDVSVRAQILNLLEKLQNKFNLTYIFISHDLSVVRHICDRVAVMYLGKIAEMGPIDHLFDHPHHPYSKALIDAVPIPDPKIRKRRKILEGEVETPIDPPSRCRFSKRCSKAQERCFNEEPQLESTTPDRLVACFFPYQY